MMDIPKTKRQGEERHDFQVERRLIGPGTGDWDQFPWDPYHAGKVKL